ncbi:MAG: TlpA family protein disulfide reductase [Bacillaceae bacterium]
MIRKIAIATLLLVMIGYAFYSAYEKRQEKIVLEKIQQEQKADASTYGLKKNNQAPDFRLTTIDGQEIVLSSLKENTVIVNFWATWCPPCREEIPDLVAFQQELPKDVKLISINLTHAERTDLEGIENYMSELEINYPVLLDPKGKVTDQYQVISIPTTYIINKKGLIKNKHIGPLTKEQLIEMVK